MQLTPSLTANTSACAASEAPASAEARARRRARRSVARVFVWGIGEASESVGDCASKCTEPGSGRLRMRRRRDNPHVEAITRSAWAYPALEIAHLCGVGLLLGSLVVFELRLWGRGAGLDARALSRLALPVTLAGFALAAASGAIMLATAFDEMLANRVFVAKMALVALAGLNAVWFHARDGLAADDRLARAQTVLSTGLWIAVIACGRWIAYK